MRTIIFWGVGETLKKEWVRIEQNREIFIEEEFIFVDSNSSLWGKEFQGRAIISPEKLESLTYDFIVITSVYEKEIRERLIHELGIDRKKILSRKQYFAMCFTQGSYQCRYKGAERQSNAFHTDHIVVYTAITGNYDDLKEPAVVGEGITYVCFTNNRKIKSDRWHVEYIRDDSLSNMLLAKKVKLEPYHFLREFETSVWVDGNYALLDDFRDYIRAYGREKPMLCFPHSARRCICDEAAACILSGRGKKETLIQQVGAYLNAGYPINHGLYECGCIVRNHHDETVRKIMEDWGNEIRRYSVRDQISLPYVCWKNKFEPDISNLNFHDNRWAKACRHN